MIETVAPKTRFRVNTNTISLHLFYKPAKDLHSNLRFVTPKAKMIGKKICYFTLVPCGIDLDLQSIIWTDNELMITNSTLFNVRSIIFAKESGVQITFTFNKNKVGVSI